jgi:LemA protein
MEPFAYALLAAAGLVILAAAAVFNRMIRLRNKVARALHDVDVQLDLRHRLLPELNRVAAGYAAHEKEVLERAARARLEAISARGSAERGLRELAFAEALREVRLLAERYPELKADSSFARLAEETVRVEDHLAAARKYYNGTVRAYNTFIQSFPVNLLAALFRFSPAAYFQLELDEEAPA